MQQTEASKLTAEDRRELEVQIKQLEEEITKSNEEWKPNMAPEIPMKIRELRRLRRMRQ